MKVYTKTGDKGETQVYAKQVLRLRKDDPILESYGTLDELNAHVGLLCSLLQQEYTEELKIQLVQVQQLLFQIGFAISAETKLVDDDVTALEQSIDRMTEVLPAQTHFILPGGAQNASQAHICRTVTRRAERQLIRLSEGHDVPQVCIRYLNRLSDFFFVVSRWLNHHQGINEPIVP